MILLVCLLDDGHSLVDLTTNSESLQGTLPGTGTLVNFCAKFAGVPPSPTWLLDEVLEGIAELNSPAKNMNNMISGNMFAGAASFLDDFRAASQEAMTHVLRGVENSSSKGSKLHCLYS